MNVSTKEKTHLSNTLKCFKMSTKQKSKEMNEKNAYLSSSRLVLIRIAVTSQLSIIHTHTHVLLKHALSINNPPFNEYVLLINPLHTVNKNILEVQIL